MRLGTLLAAACAGIAFCAPPDNLKATFAGLDNASRNFKTVSAKVRMLKHTAVINDDSVETGTINLKRERPGDVRVLIQVTQPDPKAYAIKGGKAEIYYPNAKTVQEWELGKYRGLVDQFMLLGFGSSSRELESGYNVTLVGPANVEGQSATRLALVPKSKEVRQYLTKVELWISDATSYPVQQQFYETGGEYRTVTYSDVKINPNLPKSALELQLPGGVKRERPQK
jgi:outer membrane lipoprotein-sorting protein